jgi:hypothetical protein
MNAKTLEIQDLNPQISQITQMTPNIKRNFFDTKSPLGFESFLAIAESVKSA